MEKGNDMETTIQTLTSKVDQLGVLLAQIAELEKQADAIKNELKNGDEGSVEGELFKANVILSQRTTVDYKSVLQEANVPESLVAKYSKSTAVITVKVTSR